MIQRIQSVFLALIVISMVIVFCMPLADIVTSEAYYQFTPIHLSMEVGGTHEVLHTAWFSMILAVVIVGIAIFTLFSYRNRPLQSRMCRLLLFLTLFYDVLMIWIYPDFIFKSRLDGAEFSYRWISIIFVLLPILCSYLAKRFIDKDEEKVRSADRIR